MTDATVAFAPDAAGWARLFAAIDARDADAFAAFLAEDGEFRFGNAPAVRGRAAIRAAVAGFFARHRRLPPPAAGGAGPDTAAPSARARSPTRATTDRR